MRQIIQTAGKINRNIYEYIMNYLNRGTCFVMIGW